ncbi:MAG: glycosyltransferase [Chloroflexota bacterium]|nr:glycosyltransferase [Chloroflexota bacterium]
MTPVVSVLIAAYNMGSYLPIAIESVLAQDFDDFELVISDNMSTDETSDIGQRYARQDARIKYFRNSVHVNAAENFNLCYQRSNPAAKYWAMLAADDWWKPGLLSTLVGVADRDPSLTIIHTDATLTHADGNPSSVKYSELWNHFTIPIPGHGPHQGVRQLFQGCYIMALATLVNRDMKEHILPTGRLMDPSLMLTPDYDLWLQLFVRGAKAFYVDEPLAYYRKHDTAMTMPWNDLRRLREEMMIFKEKLAGICPPELEELRVETLQSRLAHLGFELLAAEQPNEARRLLREAGALHSRRRLDIPVARLVSGLPLPAPLRASIWQQAVRGHQMLVR